MLSTNSGKSNSNLSKRRKTTPQKGVKGCRSCKIKSPKMESPKVRNALNERNKKHIEVVDLEKELIDKKVLHDHDYDKGQENQAIKHVKRKNTKKSTTNKKVIPLKQITDYFPVRRSERKPKSLITKEKQQELEEAILSGYEDNFKVVHTNGKGRGVITQEAIRKGDFVLEYSGELIEQTEANRREALYSKKDDVGCYMYYFTFRNKRYCVDATKETSRLGRLVNHSKTGNLKTVYFVIKDLPRLILVANRDIEAGEELLYDYGDRSKSSLESHPWLAL